MRTRLAYLNSSKLFANTQTHTACADFYCVRTHKTVNTTGTAHSTSQRAYMASNCGTEKRERQFSRHPCGRKIFTGGGQPDALSLAGAVAVIDMIDIFPSTGEGMPNSIRSRGPRSKSSRAKRAAHVSPPHSSNIQDLMGHALYLSKPPVASHRAEGRDAINI